jgi:hypothetical protein
MRTKKDNFQGIELNNGEISFEERERKEQERIIRERETREQQAREETAKKRKQRKEKIQGQKYKFSVIRLILLAIVLSIVAHFFATMVTNFIFSLSDYPCTKIGYLHNVVPPHVDESIWTRILGLLVVLCYCIFRLVADVIVLSLTFIHIEDYWLDGFDENSFTFIFEIFIFCTMLVVTVPSLNLSAEKQDIMFFSISISLSILGSYLREWQFPDRN